MNQTIKDINGKSIEVVDVKAAILQARNFMDYAHEDRSYSALDEKLHSYWTDIHTKFKALETTSLDNQKT